MTVQMTTRQVQARPRAVWPGWEVFRGMPYRSQLVVANNRIAEEAEKTATVQRGLEHEKRRNNPKRTL